MSEYKVTAVEFEEKSVQQVEEELLQKHEEEQKAKLEVPTPIVVPSTETELDDDKVLSFIKTKYNKELNSIDDLLTSKEATQELPQDVEAFYKYKKETGRGIEDFIKLNRDFEKLEKKDLIAEYLAIQNPELDKDDILFDIDKKYSFEEEYDDVKEIKEKKIALKKDFSEALKYFEQQKEQYKVPVVSTEFGSTEDKVAYEDFKKQASEAKTINEKNKAKSDYFVKQTNDLFNEKFKGFEFNIDGKSFLFNPESTDKIKENQMNVNNFISSHLNDEGLLKDASSYHKSLMTARHADSLAKYFYEQGKADAITTSARNDKNIDMGGLRKSPEVVEKGGIKVSIVEDGDSSVGKFRAPKQWQ